MFVVIERNDALRTARIVATVEDEATARQRAVWVRAGQPAERFRTFYSLTIRPETGRMADEQEVFRGTAA